MASLRSEDPFLKVGAVALDGENRILATGYNGLKSGFTLTRKEWQDREGRLPYVIHAEVNCLTRCVRGEVKTMAVTTLPCRACATTVAAHGVQTILYGQPYHRDMSSLTIFKRYGIAVKHVPLENAVKAIARGLQLHVQ